MSIFKFSYAPAEDGQKAQVVLDKSSLSNKSTSKKLDLSIPSKRVSDHIANEMMKPVKKSLKQVAAS